MPALEISHLTKQYGSFTAVDAVSFSVDEGITFGLLGPNGAGKSTMIKMLTGFLKPTSGDASIAGVSIRDVSKIKPLIGLAPQENSFYEKLTVWENLLFFGSLYGLSKKTIEKRGKELLDLLQLSAKTHVHGGSLSGGMKRRLNMAIALLHKPKVVFLDEPSAGVDPLSRIALWDVVKTITKEKVTVILSSHYLAEVDKLCSQVAIMNKGKLVAFDDSARLKKKYGHTLEEVFVKVVQ